MCTCHSQPQILIISSVHIIDVTSKFLIYKVINIPVGHLNNTAIAMYKINTEYLAVSIDNNRYMILNPAEASICLHSAAKICIPSSPIFPFRTSKSCAAALYIRHNVEKNCQKVIRNDLTLPSARHITKGIWILTTNKPLILTTICNTNQREKYTIKPYFQIFQLKSNCRASSDHIILPAYFHGQSTNKIHRDNILIPLYNISYTPSIWKPIMNFDKNFEIPKHLKGIKEIPMNNVIQSLQEIKERELFENKMSNEQISLMAIGILVGVFILFYLSAKLKFIKNLYSKLRNACRSKGDVIGRKTDGREQPATSSAAVNQPLDETQEAAAGRQLYPSLQTFSPDNSSLHKAMKQQKL